MNRQNFFDYRRDAESAEFFEKIIKLSLRPLRLCGETVYDIWSTRLRTR